MTDLNALISANAKRWSKAKLNRNFDSVAKKLVSQKLRYQAVSQQTGVPWAVIAVIHEREASGDWTRSIAQGDPWMKTSIHVPAGRGPFGSWDEAAIDALTECAPHAARWHDWSIGGALTLLEQYNGLGYFDRGVPSPYIWSGTDQYSMGKYVRDRVYDPHVVDQQLGCAGLLMTMMSLDPTITFTGSTITTPPKKPAPVPPPSVTNPSPGSIGSFIANLISAILSIFRKK